MGDESCFAEQLKLTFKLKLRNETCGGRFNGIDIRDNVFFLFSKFLNDES